MPLASSSVVQIRVIPEAVFGVIPVAGNPRNLRVTGDTLDFLITKEPSKEINATRTISSVIPVDAKASGALNGEISYQEWDVLMAAAYQNTFTVFGTAGVQSTATTIAYTATTLTNSVTALAGNDVWTILQRGQWFKVFHPANPNDGKILRVSPTVSPTATVITLDASTPAVVSAAAAGGLLASSRLTHGTTQSSFSLERSANDISQFLAYTGMTPSKMDVSVSSGALSSIMFDFMGKSATRAAATQLPGTPIASYAYDIHSGVAGATCQLWEGGAPITNTFVKSISLSYDNSLRSQGAVCTVGAVSIGSGTIQVSGNMSVYFADGALFDKFKANTNSSIIFSSVDGAGNGYIFTIPAVNISSWKTNASAKDQDMMIDLQFIGLRDATNAIPALQKAIFVDRVGALLT